MTDFPMPANTTDFEKKLWDAADELRANSKLKSSEYSMPVLGLIFLRYAEMANPPFNVDKVDKERMAGDPRLLELGMPKADNANYIWIHFFYSALNETGRAGFVMANSASDARGSELEIRQKLIKAGVVDVMVAVGSNFFYTVTLPCTLWFLDKGKQDTFRKNKVLFVDARQTYRQIDRAHREFTDEQIEFLANIVRLYRKEAIETGFGSEELVQAHFPEGEYIDIPGLCKVATLAEIEEQGWSLNPGRYVGVAAREADDFDFLERLEELNEELETLNREAGALEQTIAEQCGVVVEWRTFMNITLKPEQAQFIQDQLAQGNYQSADEVIAQALKVLAQQQRDYAAWVEEVRVKVDEAAAELARGEGIPIEVVLKLVQAKFQQARSHLTTDQTRSAIVDDFRALFRQTQAIPGLEQLTEDDIAAEIAAYRIGCPNPNT